MTRNALGMAVVITVLPLLLASWPVPGGAELFSPQLYYKQFDEYSFQQEMTITPIFAPDNALEAWVGWINAANTTIEAENQYLSSWGGSVSTSPIFVALAAAAGRGVSVRVIINEEDYSTLQDYQESAAYLLDLAGVTVKYMAVPDTTHDKFLAVDEKVVIVASTNWSSNSFENNREAGVVLQSSMATDYFLGVFEVDWSSSKLPVPPSSALGQAKASLDTLRDIREVLPVRSMEGHRASDLELFNFTGSYNVTLFASPDTAHETIFKFLEAAKQSVWVEMYTLSKQAFVDTLLDLKAHNPSIDIRVLLSEDRVGSTEDVQTYPMALQLYQAGISVQNTSSVFTYTHAKFWMIDGKTTFVYSGNWSPRSVPDPESDNNWAEGSVNRDMGVAIHNADVTDFYEQVFLNDWGLGVPWSTEAISTSTTTGEPTGVPFSVFGVAVALSIVIYGRNRSQRKR